MLSQLIPSTTITVVAFLLAFVLVWLWLYRAFRNAPPEPVSHESEDLIQHGPDGTRDNGTRSN